jgi:DNA polymerase III subunit gamma/tau
MAVLYRKYRPRAFAEIVGQEAIVRTLRNAVSSSSLAHAYLFTGSRGVGKTSIARILAKAANCSNPKAGDACLACDSCLALAEPVSLDIIEIDAASHTGVEHVRELIEHVQFRPTRSRYKVYIIDEVHMLSKAAFNALLKTLEEPPQHALFILATTEIQKVPLTIISRTQRFDFHRIETTAIQAQLEQVVASEGLVLPAGTVALVAAQSDGGLRDALSLLEKVATLGPAATRADIEHLLGVVDQHLVVELLDLVLERRAHDLPAFFDQLLMLSIDMSLYTKALLEYARQLLVFKVSQQQVVAGTGQADQTALQLRAGQVTVAELLRLMRLLLRSLKEAEYAPSPDMALLLACVEAAAKPESGTAKLPDPRPVMSNPASSIVTPTRPPAVSSVSTPVSEPVVVAAGAAPQQYDTMSFEDALAVWPAVATKLKTVNSPLATLVRQCPVVAVADGNICIQVRYIFHKEHLESTKIHALLTQTIQEATGKNLGLTVTLAKVEPVGSADVAEAVGDALKVFGGELVQ